MSSTVYFVSGSSRGIGCEIVRQLSLKPNALVVAGVRDPAASPELMEIVKQSAGRVVPLVLDVSSQASIAAAVEAIKQVPFVKANNSSIDVLLEVAGSMVAGFGQATNDTLDSLKKDIETNYYGSVLVTLAFMPLLKSSPKSGPVKIVYISTKMASLSIVPLLPLGLNVGGSSYSSSKAAANMWFRKLAVQISEGSSGLDRPGGTIVALIHPGLVQTTLSHGLGMITTGESVRGVLGVEEGLQMKDHGGFFEWNGEVCPW